MDQEQIKDDIKQQQIKDHFIQQIKDDIDVYIKLSKEVIDEYLDRHDYRQALGRLLMTLVKIDETGKQDMLEYYINNMKRFNI